MKFHDRLLPGQLLRRYKRFLADVRLENGEVVVAHCANPGSMATCLEEGGRIWLSRAANPKRKLKYTWELAEVKGETVYVNPARANDVVVEGIKRRVVAELSNYDLLRREVPYGERSRIDVLLSGRGECYVEVKNVTLTLGSGRSAFPDSVTARGKRHLEELSEVVRSGRRGVMLFCASRSGAQSVEPADSIDPAYGQALREAARCGVELLAYGAEITTDGVTLTHRLPVLLP